VISKKISRNGKITQIYNTKTKKITQLLGLSEFLKKKLFIGFLIKEL
jgi:hypothetical protein